MSDEWSSKRAAGGPKPPGRTGEEEKEAAPAPPPESEQLPPPPPVRPRPGAEEDGRFRYAPEYPPMYPPGVEGQVPPMYAHPMHPYPPSAQWGGYPPPMNYGMYPPFAPGYPPPHYPPHAPPYGYPEHPRYPGDMPYPEGGRGESVASRRETERREAAAGEADDYEDYEEEEDSKRLTDTSSSSRARLYVKSKVPTRQEILDRRARKNQQSRARAEKLRDRIAIIQSKSDSARTEEEKEVLASFQYRRSRKNDRSRERAIEKKTEIERILAKPEKKRSKIERDFLDTALAAKARKNQGDRMRRQRLKQVKMSHHRGGETMGYSSGMSDIPMSPLPPGSGHPSMASPATLASPGMMPNITFPSPTHARRHPALPGSVDSHGQGRSEGGSGGRVPLSFAPPDQEYGIEGDSPPARSQLHMPQPSSNVEQRRHPDGSMSISIGRKPTGGPSYGEGGEEPPSPADASASNAGNVNLSDDVSQMLLYGETNDEQQGSSGGGADGSGDSNEEK